MWSEQLGVRRALGMPGLTALEMVDAAERRRHRRALPRRVEPDRGAARPAAGRGSAGATSPLRVHQDIVRHQPDARRRRRRDPAAGRHALRAGGRRDEHDDRAPDRVQPAGGGAARRGPQRVAGVRRPRDPGAARPRRRGSTGTTTTRCARRSARSSTCTPGIEDLSRQHDQVQYGGRHLCAGGVFPTPSGKGRFTVVAVEPDDLGPDEFFCSTRRGKQFNSMIYAEKDPLTGATPRRRLHRLGRRGRARDRRRRPDPPDRRGRRRSTARRSSSGSRAQRPGALAGGQRAARRRSRPTANRKPHPRLQRRRHDREAVTPGLLGAIPPPSALGAIPRDVATIGPRTRHTGPR